MIHAFLNRTTFTAVLGMCCMISSCGPKPVDVSKTSHDQDRPTRGTDAWQWYGLSSSQYDDAVAPIVGVSSQALLDDSHALVEKTQFWLDKIDAQIRGEHPQALANVPKPLAKVVRESSPNAFVAPVGVCYDVKVKVAGASGSQADMAYFDLKGGELSSFPDQLPCVEGAADAQTIKKVVERYNAGTRGDCRLTFNGSDQVTLNSSCKVNADLNGATSAKKLVVLQTANFVTVHTGLFPLMTEEAFVGVIAHELGHYYRSHMTAAEQDYDFFYTLDRNQPARRPVAEEARRELGEGAVASATLLSTSDVHRSYSAQKLRSELFFAVGTLIKATCGAGSCSTACSSAKTLIDTQTWKTKIATFPFGAESATQGGAVTDFETKALACLETVKLAQGSGTVTATSVSWDVVTGAVSSPTWPAWLGTLPASTLRAVAGILALDAVRLGGAAPAGTELKTVLLNASKLLASQDKTSVDTLKLAQSSKLGQYTSEQEADELSAEWVSAIGIDAKASVEAMHSLGKGSETGLRGFSLGQEDCEALWENDWLDQNGQYYFVPVGDYSEIHHSVCYRMFNLEREITAHNHRPANVPLPTMGGQQWKNLQDTAEGLGLTPDFGGGNSLTRASRTMEFARKGNMASCVYGSSYW